MAEIDELVVSVRVEVDPSIRELRQFEKQAIASFSRITQQTGKLVGASKAMAEGYQKVTRAASALNKSTAKLVGSQSKAIEKVQATENAAGSAAGTLDNLSEQTQNAARVNETLAESIATLNRNLDRIEKNATEAAKGVDRVGDEATHTARRLERLKKGTRAAFDAFKKAAAVTAVLSAATALLVRHQLNVIGAMAKTSDRLNIAIEDLIAFRHAVEQNGGSAEMLDMGLQRMTRRISEAAAGTGEAVKALEELGLDAHALAAQDAGTQFRIIADAISQVESQSRRTALTMKLFDSEGVKLLNTLQQGSKALDRYAEEAERLGLVLSRTDAAQIEAANDAMDRLGKLAEGVIRQFTVQIAPSLTAFVDGLVAAAAAGDGVTGAMGGVGSAAEVVFRQATKVTAFWIGALRNTERAILGVRILWLESVAAMEVAWSAFKNALSGEMEFWKGVGDLIASAFQEPLQILGRMMSKLVGAVVGVLNKALVELREALIDVVPQSVSDNLFDLASRLRVAGARASKFYDELGKPEKATAAFERIKRSFDTTFKGGVVSEETAAELKESFLKAFQLGDMESPAETARIAVERFNQALSQAMQEAAESEEGSGVDGKLSFLGMLGLNPEQLSEGLGAAKDQILGWLFEIHGIKREMTEEEMQWAKDLAAFEKMTAKDRAKTVLGEVERMTQGIARHNRAAFEINKATGIASATINAYEAFNKNLASYPQPLGGILAAGALASGLAQVNAIRSTSFGGGGSSGGAPAPTPAPANVADAATGAAAPQQNITIDSSGLDTIPSDNLMRVGDTQAMLNGVNDALQQRGQQPLTQGQL